jgi:hypothetical protein
MDFSQLVKSDSEKKCSGLINDVHFITHIHAMKCAFELITYVRSHSHVLADDNKMPFKCSVAHQLLLKFTKSLTVFEQHCPQ